MTPKKEHPEYSLWEKLIYFFPVQLVFVHLKKNLLLLSFWFILFAIITKNLSLKYGVPYLFLYPEYLEAVGVTSHILLGLCTGAFIMAFNISSYIVNGFRFPFLATLNRPFIKYCQNNTLIPLAFIIVYMISAFHFQTQFEDETWHSSIINMLSFLLGNFLFILITAIYFMLTNKNFEHYRLKKREHSKRFFNPIFSLFSNDRKWEQFTGKSRKEWKVVSYIGRGGKLMLARDSSHYDRQTIENVFSQNKVNASFFQFGVLLAMFFLGWLYQYDWLMIPAASSVLLFFTMLIMLVSALYSWFRSWTYIVLIVGVISLNNWSKTNFTLYSNQAYGLDYNIEKADYTNTSIAAYQTDSSNNQKSVEIGIEILNNWLRRQDEEKPVAVFVNVPGGGLRSAVWTMQALDRANKTTQGKLWDKTILISGSSGGMIGAAYLREFNHRYDVDTPIDTFVNNLGKDKLNAVAATAVLNDVFFRFKHFEYSGQRYVIDRASAFESKLNLDTDNWLNKPLSDYRQLEYNMEMPLMILSPTISNDGRKLLISSQPISYLCHINTPQEKNENIEFSQLFKSHGAERLNFATALRMSATFPYVFPSTNLPTTPDVEILDAGIRDNFGMTNTLSFIHTFKDWLSEHTSGIIIVQVRDQQKFAPDTISESKSFFETITQPFGTFYNTVLEVQDYQQDHQLRLTTDWFDGAIKVTDLVLERSPSNPISLSWHLTAMEKQRINDALFYEYNTQQFEYLVDALKQESTRGK